MKTSPAFDAAVVCRSTSGTELALPFPGPVVGMILLIPALAFPQLREPVKAVAEAISQRHDGE